MGALANARAGLAGALDAAGIEVRQTPSRGHMGTPAVLIGPGSEWIVANAQLGAILHARVALAVTFLAGKQAAEASLVELEDLIEDALPVLAGAAWTLTAIGQPYGLTIAGTEYLAASATLVRAITIPPSSS